MTDSTSLTWWRKPAGSRKIATRVLLYILSLRRKESGNTSTHWFVIPADHRSQNFTIQPDSFLNLMACRICRTFWIGCIKIWCSDLWHILNKVRKRSVIAELSYWIMIVLCLYVAIKPRRNPRGQLDWWRAFVQEKKIRLSEIRKSCIIVMRTFILIQLWRNINLTTKKTKKVNANISKKYLLNIAAVKLRSAMELLVTNQAASSH